MDEIWFSRRLVEQLLPVICRIGALLAEDIYGDGFWVRFAMGTGE